VCIGQGVVGESRVNESTYFRNVSTSVQSGTAFDTVTVRLGDGRPGDVVSSRRYKEDIQPMDTASEPLFALQPVVFRYKKEADPERDDGRLISYRPHYAIKAAWPWVMARSFPTRTPRLIQPSAMSRSPIMTVADAGGNDAN
jgi:Chaperone of endosialidase